MMVVKVPASGNHRVQFYSLNFLGVSVSIAIMFFFSRIVNRIEDQILSATFLCLLLMSCILNIITTIHFWYQSRKYINHSSSEDTQKSFIRLRIICLLHMIACTGMLFFCACWTVPIAINPSSFNQPLMKIFYGISQCCRFISNMTFLSFQILRLHLTFKNTFYSIKPQVIIIHCILTIIVAFGILIGWIFIDFSKTDKYIGYYSIFAVILWLTICIIQIDIARLFSNKLFAITLSIRSSQKNLNINNKVKTSKQR